MRFEGLTPVIYVDAIEPSLPFWTERLGFEVGATVPHGDALGFAILARDGVRVMLQSRASLAEDMPEVVKGREPAALLYLDVDDLDAVEAALGDWPRVVERRVTFYGAHEVAVRAPDGTPVCFAWHPER